LVVTGGALDQSRIAQSLVRDFGPQKAVSGGPLREQRLIDESSSATLPQKSVGRTAGNPHDI
jgi:hypothetical protein